VIRGAFDGRGGHAGAQHAFNDPLDTIGPAPRSQSNGEPNLVPCQGSRPRARARRG
jgi:hypothetical protein